MTITEASMAAKGFKCEMRKAVSDEISLLRKTEDPSLQGEILVSLMGRNTPTFRQWRRVLWWLFKKKFADRNTLYTIYQLAIIKANEEGNRIRSRQKREEFQGRQRKFSDWFWLNHNQPLT
jgi:hypothetical protein